MAHQEQTTVPHWPSPRPLLTINAMNKWQLDAETAQLLSNIQTPISSIAIVGKYRTGKSYLMNRLMGASNGFALGDTVQSKTKGIWIIARPHPQNAELCLMLLDTEGFSDVEKGDDTHDIQIFTFALLLSKCLTFNAMQTIDDGFIKNMQFVTELSRKLKVQQGRDEAYSEAFFAKYFPYLMVVVRDFYLDLEINGVKVSSKEYLENALKPQIGSSSQILSYNAAKQCIRQYFPERNCFTIVRPVSDESELRHLEREDIVLREKFIQDADKVITAILAQAKPIVISAKKINGAAYLELVNEYVHAVNEGGIPCIESSMERMTRSVSRGAMNKAFKQYDEAMRSVVKHDIPISQDLLDDSHKTYRRNARTQFESNALFEEDGKHALKLEEMLKSRMEYYTEENRRFSEERSRAAIQKHFSSLEKGIKDNSFVMKGGYDIFLIQLNAAISQYKNELNLGPMKDQVLKKCTDKKYETGLSILAADKALVEEEKQKRKLQEAIRKKEEEIRAREEQRVLNFKIETEKREALRLIKEKEREFQNYQADQQKQIQKLTRQHEEELQRMQNQKWREASERQQKLLARLQEEREDFARRTESPSVWQTIGRGILEGVSRCSVM